MLRLMSEDADPTLAARQREALISLTAMHYIEEHALLDDAQLTDAKQSLQALFLRTSGAETMLRRLIEILKVKRNMHSTFSHIANTFTAIRRSIEAIEERASNLRRLIERTPVSAEANEQFVGPFLSFTIKFLQKMAAFEKLLEKYLVAREQEVRIEASHRIAQETRERLRQRLTTSSLGQADGNVETRIKADLTTSLNFDEVEANLRAAVRQARGAEAEVQAQLEAIKVMCQAATELSKRSMAVKAEDDILVRFAKLLASNPSVRFIEAPVRELFGLYRSAHGMFQLDFDKLKNALLRLSGNSSSYFSAKQEDSDMAAKREKLRKIEALIQFLERAAQLSTAEELNSYHKFSKAFSEAISERLAPWAFAAANLLTAKLQAEAQMSTQFNL
jgi:hypothetical protein